MIISRVDLTTLLLLVVVNALWFSLLAVLVVAPSAIANRGAPSRRHVENAAAAVLVIGLIAALGMSFSADDGYAMVTGGTAVAYALCLWGCTSRWMGPILPTL